jgi:hypothetical protein
VKAAPMHRVGAVHAGDAGRGSGQERFQAHGAFGGRGTSVHWVQCMFGR